MDDFLTTGEMIDRLKVGEVAESKNLKAYFDNNFQLISESKNTGVKTEFTIWTGTRGNKIWRILPKYVTFEEAMKALKDGKKVVFHSETSQNHYGDKMIELQKDSYLHTAFYGWNLHKFETLLDGKWQIIE